MRKLIGLFGGSFDPPHAGHLKVASTALRGFGLDEIWWLPTPWSPFKPDRQPLSFNTRCAKIAELIASNPFMHINDIERDIQPPHFSWKTLQKILQRNRNHKFVWICGADSFASLHKWERADFMERNICFAVLGRPGTRMFGYPAPTRIPRRKSPGLAKTKPPGWAFTPLHEDISSTQLRKAIDPRRT